MFAENTSTLLLRLLCKNFITNSKNSIKRTARFSKRIRYFSSNNAAETAKLSGACLVKSPFPDIALPTTTLDQYVWTNIDRWPDHTAMVCGLTGRKYSYRQIRLLTRRFAASLQKQGFQTGDVLCIILPNSPEFPIILFGAVEAGLTVSTMNYMYTPYEIAHQMEDCEAVCVVTDSEVLPKLRKAVDIIQSKRKKSLPLLTISVATTTGTVPDGTADFDEMISDNVDTSHVRTSSKPDDVVIMPYSSGTTGLSKGVQLTHSNITGNSQQISYESVLYTFQTTVDRQAVIPGILPFYHIYGMLVVLINSLYHGNKIVTLPKFDQKIFPSILKDHKVTTVFAVPPVVIYLGNYEGITSDHLVHLKYMITGAGPVGVSDIEKVLAKSSNNGLKINQGYGLTETSSVITITPKYVNDYSSIGVPIPRTVMKVIKEDGSLCVPGESGEICARGPQIMKAYHKLPDATAKTIDQDHFLHTGDVGYYDEDGKFYIVERMKELIKVKGFQVPPAELEAVIRTFPGVLEAAVIGVPDEKTGEKPLAFVIRDSRKNVNEDLLMKYVEQKVAPFKKLTGVIFVDSIPKNPSGKILRRILRDEYKEKHVMKSPK